ncbi:hypothetical protein H9P43_000511 [Blastocladiella emersonii ATCC 22665]|nr:hypothetical protein H9P43_000511 [Blastocladiella emersonii ATCC 22665]
MVTSSTKHASPAAEVVPARSDADLATQIVQDLQRHVNILSDPSSDRWAKLRTLDHIKKEVVLPLIKSRSVAVLTPVLRVLAPVLVRAFVDPVEKVREVTADLLTRALEVVQVDSFLPDLIPPLVDRFTSESAPEPSEEIRLQLIKLLGLTISRCEVDPTFIVQDACALLNVAVADSFPDVRKEACLIVVHLARRCPEQFRLHAEKLIKNLTPALGFRHAAVRTVALQAMGAAIMADAGTLRNTWPAIKKLAMDSVTSVRRQLYKECIHWQVHLTDRYSFADLFVSVLLRGLGDDVAELRAMCRDGIAEVSALYEREWTDRIKDRLDYATPAERELLGFRTLVRENMLKMTDAIAEAMGDWNAAVREVAAITLQQLVPHAQDHISGYLGKLVPAMVKTVTDTFAPMILGTARLIGSLVSPDLILTLTLQHIRGPSYLRFFTHAIQDAPLQPAHLDMILRELADYLDTDPTASTSEDVAAVYLHFLGRLTANPETAAAIDTVAVLTVGLHLGDLPAVNAALQAGGPVLFEASPRLLEVLTTRPVASLTPGLQLLCKFIAHAPSASVFSPHLLPVLAKVQKDEEALIRALQGLRARSTEEIPSSFALASWPFLMSHLEWRSGRKAMAVRAEIAPLVLRLLPLLIAVVPDGLHRTPAATRAGVSHVGDPSAFAHPEPSALTDVLVSAANCLDDDAPGGIGVATRTTAIAIIRLVAEQTGKDWSSEHAKAVYPELLKRLDDTQDAIRIAAAGAIGAMYANVAPLAKPAGEEGAADAVHHEAIVTGVTIHVDDPNVAVRDAALDCLRSIARVQRDAVAKYIATSTRTFRNRAALDQLLEQV